MRFCDICNEQGWGKCYFPRLYAKCDNTYQDIDYSGYHKTKFNNIVLLYIVSKKITTNIYHHMEHSLQYFP